MSAVVITPDHPAWPEGLRDLPDMPERLWVRGNLQALSTPAIAIVGARASTAYGEVIAQDFAQDTVEHGMAVVSGLAYGIDTAGHRGALASGGITVAYVAGGVDKTYPVGNHRLAEQILRTGAIVSEYEPGSAPSRTRFLERNRLIAAHAQQLVVVEAGLRSGSLNAARNASRLSRPVWAVPGPVTSATSSGSNDLIRHGTARLVENAGQIFARKGTPHD